ncbi:hypothetical protein F5Y14DRAFT_112232 [Nemania sp. NC0429]|nr:hypothetical protein F5Y14DRAFT_112232 [Nemania sp. NC0429]
MRLPLHIGIPMQPGIRGRSDVGYSASASASSLLLALARRQLAPRDDDDDDESIWFWYTTTGIIIKYTLFFAFLFIIAVWVIGGRTHARRRLRKGQKPLAYHAWLLSRAERAQVDPAYALSHAPHAAVYRPVYGGGGGGDVNGVDYYGMHPVPPPVYDPSRPPVYDGPPAGSKIDPVQDRRGQGQEQGVTPEYAPPAGPPPGR